VTDQDPFPPTPADPVEETAPRSDVPRTGIDDVDRALAELEELDRLPVADHHDRLARVHEALHQALHRPSEDGPADG